MTSTRHEKPATTRPARWVLWPAALLALWIGLAAARPATTYHLAPLLVAGAPLTLAVLDGAGVRGRRAWWLPTLAGLALGVGGAFVLELLDKTQGPAFEVFPGPFVEALVATGAGAAIGLIFALVHQAASAR